MGSVKKLGRPWVHAGVMCDGCKQLPILGHRMKCQTCKDHDFCLKCHDTKQAMGQLGGCVFVVIEVDSSVFYPPHQIHYYSCRECYTIPIVGPRYTHTRIQNWDLCDECYHKAGRQPGDFGEIKETRINTLCPSFSPGLHFHRECLACGQIPIFGPRFDTVSEVWSGKDASLCQICFDTIVSSKTISGAAFERVDRPEDIVVVQLRILCCMQCGENPICGPAFVNTRVPNDILCLSCYQHLDPSRWQYQYTRVEPPKQYMNPEPDVASHSDVVSQLAGEQFKSEAAYLNLLLQLQNAKITSSAEKDEGTHNVGNSNSGNHDLGNSSGGSWKNDEDLDKLDSRLDSAVLAEKPNVKWDDIAGLENAKQALQEAVVFPIKYPQFFEGDRQPWRAFLLYGPPGTGKSYLAKAVATEVSSTFYSISASDLGSKWIGESEKLVSLLFEKARKTAPSIIFIDEIDSIAGERSENDTTAVKTEILVQMQGVGKNNDKVLVLAATNLPYRLDQALRRRFDKRIYIPLPDQAARKEMFKIHLKKTPHSLNDEDFEDLAARTPGFSGSDVGVSVKDVLWAPIRQIQTAEFFCCHDSFWYACGPGDTGAVRTTLKDLEAKQLAKKVKPLPINRADFDRTLTKQRPTVGAADLKLHRKFTVEFGEAGSETGEQRTDAGGDIYSDEYGDKLASSLESAVVKENPNVKWSDVAGLESVKRAMHEAVVLPVKHPQFFTGNRKPWSSFLLYGPPGTGKSFVAKAVATEVDSTFFSISSSDLGGHWHGDSERLVATLFQKARSCAPSIIFIDEIDSVCGQRISDGSPGSEVDMRVKTEMLVQMQGVGSKNDKVLILAATNLPYALDPAIRRRFDKRIYIPLPDHPARAEMFRLHLGHVTPHRLTDRDFEDLAWQTAGFSGSDIAVCVKGVLFEPIRKVQAAQFFMQVYSADPGAQGRKVWIPCGPYDSGAYSATMKDLEAKGWGGSIQLPPIVKADFDAILASQTSTVRAQDLAIYEQFTREFGEQG